MMYAVVTVKGQDEFTSLITEDKAEAIEQARNEWASLTEYDKATNVIEVREYAGDPEEVYDYNLIGWKLWYAVEMDREDNDWGTGSYDLDEAKAMAEDMNALLIAVIDRDECIDEIEMYDSFRVSAVFDDGATIDNDIVEDTTASAVENELEDAREWFADRNPEGYMVSYYRDGECIRSEVK